MMKREFIKDWKGIVLGSIDTDTRTGDKTVKDFYGRVLGKYIKNQNVTKDFYGRLVGQGDQAVGLLFRKNK